MGQDGMGQGGMGQGRVGQDVRTECSQTRGRPAFQLDFIKLNIKVLNSRLAAMPERTDNS